jgi:hypothetical protein
MIKLLRRIGRAWPAVLLAAAFVLIGSAVPAATEVAKAEPLWFDATQLPSFTGIVDRYLPNPDGRVDRLIFKEGPQIVFPPDAFEAVREAALAGRPLVVWGIRARGAAVITMLAFGAPNKEPTVLDRFYWRAEPARKQGRREMLLIGTVWVPYLSPQGQITGAILENGDVIRVEQKIAAMFKDLFVAGAPIVAGGTGSETPLGRAIDADQIGHSIALLESVPHPPPLKADGETLPTR